MGLPAQGGLIYDTAFNLLLGRVYDDKDLQEYLIRNSGLDWTIVRPVILTNGRRTGSYRVLRDRGLGFVPRAEVAHFLVEQVTSDAYLGKTPVLMGVSPPGNSPPGREAVGAEVDGPLDLRLLRLTHRSHRVRLPVHRRPQRPSSGVDSYRRSDPPTHWIGEQE